QGSATMRNPRPPVLFLAVASAIWLIGLALYVSRSPHAKTQFFYNVVATPEGDLLPDKVPPDWITSKPERRFNWGLFVLLALAGLGVVLFSGVVLAPLTEGRRPRAGRPPPPRPPPPAGGGVPPQARVPPGGPAPGGPAAA